MQHRFLKVKQLLDNAFKLEMLMKPVWSKFLHRPTFVHESVALKKITMTFVLFRFKHHEGPMYSECLITRL